MTHADNHPDWDFQTRAIHDGVEKDPVTGATTAPIYQTSSFEYDSIQDLSDVFHGRQFGYQYSRVTNPSITAFESRVTALHNGARGSVGVSSGMAAVTTALSALCGAGDEIVLAKSLFGGTYYLMRHFFENFGVVCRFVDTTDLSQYEAAINEKTAAVFLETIGNPRLDVPNISAIADIAHSHNVPLVVDSTVTTPYLFDGKAHGVDVLTYSVTKYMCGSGTTVAGVVTDTGNFDWRKSKSTRIQEAGKKFGELAFLGRCRRQICSNTGCILSPFNAFISALGFDTLSLRMDKHCSNAQKLAEFFESHPKVEVANYPGLQSNADHAVATQQFGGSYGGLVTLRVGSKDAAYKVIDATKIARTLVNIGDTKTLVVHPQSTIYRDFTEEEAADAGVYTDLIRVSVGLENAADLIKDFDQALSAV